MDEGSVWARETTADGQLPEELSWPGSEFEVLWRSDADVACDGDVGETPAPGPLSGKGDGGGTPASGPLSAQLVASLLSAGSVQCDLDSAALQSQLTRVLLQNLRLREAVQRSSDALRQQCLLLTQWRADNARLREQQRTVAGQCQRARDVVTQLRRENAALRQRLTEQQTQADPQPVEAGDTELQLRSQLSRAEAQLRGARLEVDRQRSKLERQRVELAAYRAEAAPPPSPPGGHPPDADSMTARLQSLRVTPLSEHESDAVDGPRRDVASSEHDQRGATYGNEQREAAVAELQRQQVNMDGLQARIISMEELLVARGTECERLQRQLIQAGRDLQAVDILKAQVDVYQQDFNQERRQREQLAVERDQLRRQLQQLQAQSRQLPPSAGSLFSPAEPSPTPEPPPQPAVYTCPKCQMAFLDVQPLENHVNRCLDEDEQTA